MEKVQQRFTRQVSGMGSLPDRLSTLKARRERGDMIRDLQDPDWQVDVDQNIWFTPLALREGAASTRATSGHLNLKRREAK